MGLRTENSRQLVVSLPYELLSQIFESACHVVISTRSDPSSVILASTLRRTTQNAILSTCRRWRQVGLATTSLWELVLVTHPNDLRADESGRTPMMTGIGRAGTRALSLYVSGTLDTYGWDKTCALLRPHAHRFRQIFVSQESHRRDSELLAELNSPQAPLPLQTLVLTWRQSRPLEQEHIDLTWATSLRHLQLNITHSRGPLVTIRPPLVSKLTHIQLGSKIDPSDAIRIISSTKSLQALKWNFHRDQTPSLDSIRSQPYLQELSLAGALPTHLLYGLLAPRLHILQITLQDASPPGISHITTQAFPNLRTLHISSYFLSNWENSPQAAVRSILSGCPQLERISMPYVLDVQLVTFLTSDSLPPHIRDVWVFVDDTVHRTGRELLNTWSSQEGRENVVLYVQGIIGREAALVEAQARGLVPMYGERVKIEKMSNAHDAQWIVVMSL